MTQKFSHYTCSICGADYAPDEVTYTCPKGWRQFERHPGLRRA